MIDAKMYELLDIAQQALEDGYADLINKGMSDEDAVDLLAAVLDAALPLQLMLPPPFEAMMGVDGSNTHGFLKFLVDATQPDPDKILERAEQSKASSCVYERALKRADRVRQRIAARKTPGIQELMDEFKQRAKERAKGLKESKT